MKGEAENGDWIAHSESVRERALSCIPFPRSLRKRLDCDYDCDYDYDIHREKRIKGEVGRLAPQSGGETPPHP